MKGALFVKNLGALRPAEEAAESMLAKIKNDDLVRVEIRRPRNLAHHRKYWALMQLIAANSDHYPTARNVHNAFMYGTGRYDEFRYKGYVDREPHSISFANMDQDEFDKYYEEAISFVVTQIMPLLDRGDLERELMEFAR